MIKWTINLGAALLVGAFTLCLAFDQPQVDLQDRRAMDDLRQIHGLLQDETDRTTAWRAYTPTGGWVTNTTYTGAYRRVGDTMEIVFKIATAGAPNNATPSVSIPSGHTINVTKLQNVIANASIVPGDVQAVDGTNYYTCKVIYNNTTQFVFKSIDVVGSDTLLGDMTSNAIPFTFGNGDYIQGWAKVPIDNW